ncbi:prepilin-type N-terminal cleavage/methylation domain-containing protein [Fodinisporobacter ferrooxydans]|uniref:Prepilin-type N-terminal cleavage/methylation domain-containing protein n=1 Tax=Fodinisporobacter ferrooxydans TaxID=2901836 RepID=A0ABY4CI14_9BACL|nr:prepilin-type N-terminal cleavage/methylation domain-containing protein [Alicyclobacillaceae bacterium MYW30-H2]
MKNEHGITLIELLATITIAVFVIGAIALTFSQVTLEWNSSANQYQDDSAARLTLDTYTKYLSGAVSVVYIQSGSGWTDLRLQLPKLNPDNTNVTKVFHYENGTVTLYDFNAKDYRNAAPSLSDYSNGLQLASNVISMPQYGMINQGTIQPLPVGSTVTSALLSIDINFNYKQVGANGSVSFVPHRFNTNVKLLSFH